MHAGKGRGRQKGGSNRNNIKHFEEDRAKLADQSTSLSSGERHIKVFRAKTLPD